MPAPTPYRTTKGYLYKNIFIEVIQQTNCPSSQTRELKEIDWWFYISLYSGNSIFTKETSLEEVRLKLHSADLKREFCHIRREISKSHEEPKENWQQDSWSYRCGDDFNHSWDEGRDYDWLNILGYAMQNVDALVAAEIVK